MARNRCACGIAVMDLNDILPWLDSIEPQAEGIRVMMGEMAKKSTDRRDEPVWLAEVSAAALVRQINNVRKYWLQALKEVLHESNDS